MYDKRMRIVEDELTDYRRRRAVQCTLPEPYIAALEVEADALGVSTGTYVKALAMAHVQVSRARRDGTVRTDSDDYRQGLLRGLTLQVDGLTAQQLEELLTATIDANPTKPRR
jgi:hypothetical protein